MAEGVYGWTEACWECLIAEPPDVSHLFDGAAVSGSLWCESKPTSINLLKASLYLRRL